MMEPFSCAPGWMLRLSCSDESRRGPCCAHPPSWPPLLQSHKSRAESKAWHHQHLCPLSRGEIRTKPQPGQWALHRLYLSPECTAGQSLPKEGLWVEGKWGSCKLFAFTTVRIGCLREIQYYADTSLCCQTGALGKQNSWWRTLPGQGAPAKRAPLTPQVLSLVIEPSETASSGCLAKMSPARRMFN